MSRSLAILRRGIRSINQCTEMNQKDSAFFKSFLVSEFRKNRDEADTAILSRKLDLADNAAFLVSGVQQHKVPLS